MANKKSYANNGHFYQLTVHKIFSSNIAGEKTRNV